jgi:twitching motility two-component system response regulator PilH
MNAVPAPGPAAARPLALVVDDSPFLAAHLSRLLGAVGLQAQVATAADELKALAPKAAVVLVEVELFHASGFEVTRELAACCSCPLILLTGTGRNTDRQWALRAGASAVLPRPVTAASLFAALSRLGVTGAQ